MHKKIYDVYLFENVSDNGVNEGHLGVNREAVQHLNKTVTASVLQKTKVNLHGKRSDRRCGHALGAWHRGRVLAGRR